MDAIIANPTTSTSTSNEPPPSLLTLILDTNPSTWHALSRPPCSLPLLPTAISQLLLFINAHLAFSHENRVAVLATHCGSTHWLYPRPESSTTEEEGKGVPLDANKYRPFAVLEREIITSLNELLLRTQPEDLENLDGGTPLAGALSLALSYINRLTVSMTPSTNTAGTANVSLPNEDKAYGAEGSSSGVLDARVLVVSASGDMANQYIPLMNAMFAAQGMGVPVDVLKLAGDSVLLQQVSHVTGGVFVVPVGSLASASEVEGVDRASNTNGKGQTNGAQTNGDAHPTSITLLPSLFTLLLPSPTTRTHLVPPSTPRVDFRAACFCHRRITSIGFVCSICLSIFCAEGVGVDVEKLGTVRGRAVNCGTCGSALVIAGLGSGLGEEGGEKKKKKKKRREEATAS